MHSADYAVARCLSVRPSICLSHAGILSKRLYILVSSLFVTIGYLCHSSFFANQTVWQYFARNPLTYLLYFTLTRASNARGMKKSIFSTNISLHLGNDTRYSYTYNGRPIECRIMFYRMAPFLWTLTDLAKY